MNFKYFTPIFSVFIILLCCSFKVDQPKDIKIKDLHLDFIDYLKKTRNISCTGLAIPCLSGINIFRLQFESTKQVDIEQARLEYIDISQAIINWANNCKALRPFLQTYPISPKNLDLYVFFNPDEADDNSIWFASSFESANIKYNLCDDQDNNDQIIHIETYEEALAKVSEIKNNVAGNFEQE